MTKLIRFALQPFSAKLFFFFWLGPIFIFSNAQAQVKPIISDTTIFPEASATYRCFFLMGSFQPLIEISGNLGPEMGKMDNYKIAEHHVRVGTYFRALKFLHLGAFYTAERGLIHDDDWTFNGTPKVNNLDPTFWSWRNTTDRLEHTLSLDLTPRAKLSIGGQTLIAELKLEYFRHFSASNDGLKIRPGISWNIAGENGDPVMTLFLQNESYFKFPVVPLPVAQVASLPANSLLYYENWLYFGSLFHLAEELSLGVSVAWKQVVWREGESYLKLWSSSANLYEVRYNALVFGVSVIQRVKLF